ncbi:hypothetical protein E1212_28710 [Jiangella ureilytica]|uniref:Uncharacterized protein n=1 Tax=Jiangella ureilytica TaxID=2530374 RepID=A0A4R4RBG5_9ACTN|nr:hypothetical protein [Jiangella ureilytica]TDC45571.1 hypothetical protein E1212_28705 [Jiangella ureilytica]TDC45572.1 hypothetical protein E1212_28710 [Jiangella ureilytica]
MRTAECPTDADPATIEADPDCETDIEEPTATEEPAPTDSPSPTAAETPNTASPTPRVTSQRRRWFRPAGRR